MVFHHVLAALVHGSGYERLASPGCPDRASRRRLAEWPVRASERVARAGIGYELLRLGLLAYDSGKFMADAAWLALATGWSIKRFVRTAPVTDAQVRFDGLALEPGSRNRPQRRSGSTGWRRRT